VAGKVTIGRVQVAVPTAGVPTRSGQIEMQERIKPP